MPEDADAPTPAPVRREPLPVLASRLFDPAFYLEEYPDAAGSGYAPLEHYLVAGIAEGRRIRPGVARRAEREPAWTRPWLEPDEPTASTDAPGAALRAAVAATARFRRHVGAGALARDRLSIQVSAARSAGVLLAPVAVLLVAAAVDAALARGLRTVHYLSREGLVLRRVHEVVAGILADEPVEARHLPVSRLATFGPSLADLSRTELARLWRMYPDQSPAALFTSLGLDPAPLATIVRRHGLDPDAAVTGIAADPAVQALLTDAELLDRVRPALAATRDVLRAYLRQEMVAGDRGDVVVVDIGWRGSIQDNLALAVPEWHWVGWYLGLLGYLNSQPPNVEKHAVGPDANRGDDTTWLGPSHVLELALSSQQPSAIGYERTADGRVRPVLAPRGGDGAGGRLAAELQAGMMLAVRAVATTVRAHGGPAAFRAALDDLLWHLLHDPPPGLADVVLESTHDETFGTLNALPFAEPAPDRRSVLAPTTTAALDRLAAEGASSRWPAGWRRWQPVRTLRASLGDRMP